MKTANPGRLLRFRNLCIVGETETEVFMSCSFLCRWCGFYESAHDEPSIAADFLYNDNMQPEDTRPGYTASYASCPGYESEDPQAESAANAALREEELLKGRIEGQQTYVWLVYSPSGDRPPFIHISDDWRG
jgi:hypothetical protein